MSHSSPIVQLPGVAGATCAPSAWRDYLDYLHDSTDTASPVSVCGYSGAGGVGTCMGAVFSPTQNRLYMIPFGDSSSSAWCYKDLLTGGVSKYPHGLGTVPTHAYASGSWSPRQDRIFFHQAYSVGSLASISCKEGTVYPIGASGLASAVYTYGGAYDPGTDSVWLTPGLGCTGAHWPAVDCASSSLRWVPSPGASGMAISSAAYSSSVYAPSSRAVYHIPRIQINKPVWHRVDCASDSVVGYAHGVTGAGVSGMEYFGGAYDPVSDRVYMAPSTVTPSREWHYIDCKDGRVVGYDHGFSGLLCGNLFHGCVYSPLTRRVYMVPKQYGTGVTGLWYYLDTDTCKLVSYKAPVVPENSYQMGCFVPGVNRVYFSPAAQAAQSTWHYIQETCGAPVPLDLGYSVAHLSSPQVSFLCIDEAEVSMLCVDGSDGKGGAYQLTTVFQDGVSRNAYCAWSSSDPSVATVSPSGLVTAVSNGGAPLGKDVTITASYAGTSYSCLVTVYQTMPSAEVEGAGLWLCKGGIGGKNSTGSIFSITADFSTTAIPPGEFCSARLVSKYCVAPDGTYAQHLKNGVASRYINQSRGANTQGAMVAVMSGTTEMQYISSSGQSVGSVYTKDIWVSPSTYQENNQPYALTNVSTDSRSVGYHNLLWGNVTHKIIFSALSKTPTKPGLTADICYIPQNYIRYSNRTTPNGTVRASYTVIPNIGTLGSDYALTANNVPAVWFGV